MWSAVGRLPVQRAVDHLEEAIAPHHQFSNELLSLVDHFGVYAW